MAASCFRHLSALILLVAMAGGLVMPLFGDLHVESDVACADDALAATSHHQTIQFESIRPAVAGDHCAICHLQRAMGGATDDAKRYVPGGEAAPWTVRTLTHTTSELVRLDVPSRAPPASAL
jgi:mono/diheme cytochrome c family protein